MATGHIPAISHSACIRCGKCIDACPREAIYKVPNPVCNKCMGYCLTMPVSCYREKVVVAYDRCDACGTCLEACPCGAIRWFDFDPLKN